MQPQPKPLILLASLVSCLGFFQLSAATYYIAPTGSDSAAGTLAAPFKSITKAETIAVSGDTVMIRGGTYNSFTIAASDTNYNYVHNLTKSGIAYQAYSTEVPTFDFASIGTSKRVCAFRINASNVTISGIRVTNVKAGTQEQSECFRIRGGTGNILRKITAFNTEANGFYATENSANLLIEDCDAYNNIGVGVAAGNSDGFGSHAGTTTFRRCRAWNNGDDGYDCISSSGAVRFENCWSYNHNQAGNKVGFKVGGYGGGTPASPLPVHTVTGCLSARNGASGFYANHQPGKAADWTNNSAYDNAGGNYNMLERVSPTDPTDIPGTREIIHSNIAFGGVTIVNENLPAANKTDNSWTKPGVTVNSADFQSLTHTQITQARPSSGGLPTITFMKLVGGSDLAGMGY